MDYAEKSPANRPSEPPSENATRVRWIVLAIVAFAAASAYLTRYCISAANTTIQAELKIDDAQMGWVMSAFSLGYLFFQVPGGWLGNRFGTRFAFAFISAVWSLCNVWSGLAGSLPSLWASRFGLGVFQAGLTPISAKILSDWIPLQNRGISSAAIAACMSLGGAFALWLTGWLLSQDVGWRSIFHAYALVGIVWAIGYYWFFRTHPREHPWVNAEELKRIGQDPDENDASDRPASKLPVSQPTALDGMVGMLTSRSMWGLCIQSFFRAAGYAFFVTWFFAFLEYVYKIDKSEAGMLNSLPLLAVVFGTWVGGFAVDALYRWTNNRWLSRSGTAFFALACSGVFTMASAWTSSATGLSIVIAIGAFFSGIGNPAAWAATIDMGGRNTSVLMGVMNMAGCLAGVVLPIALGNWFDAIRSGGGDWNLVIYLHAAFYFAGAAAWIVVDPNRLVIPELGAARDS